MDKKLSKLLDELYQLDPSLKVHDSLLRSVLSEVLASRPEATMDPEFYRDLRETLLSRVQEMKASTEERFTTPRFSLFPRMAYAFGGLAVVTGIAVLANGVLPQSGILVKRVGPEAYGTLSYSNAAGEKGGLGGGGAVDSMIWLPDERINYEFNYTGEALTGFDSVDVLKRDETSNVFDVKVDTDAFNVSHFGAMEAAYTNLVPVDGEGYSLNFDPNGQLFSFNEVHPYSPECPWGSCSDLDTSPLKSSELPSDESLIAVSESFFNDIDLDRTLLGEPYVNEYFIGENSEVDYMLTVTYPLEIEGKPVYMTWGGRSGVTVSIDAHRMKVTNANWIYASKTFSSSSYEGIAADEIVSLAQKGGVSSSQWDDPTKTVTLDLGTPTLIYSEIQNYTEYGTYNDLYAPAYLFPIVNDTEDVYYGDWIVVPLAKDLAVISRPNVLY